MVDHCMQYLCIGNHSNQFDGFETACTFLTTCRIQYCSRLISLIRKTHFSFCTYSDITDCWLLYVHFRGRKRGIMVTSPGHRNQKTKGLRTQYKNKWRTWSGRSLSVFVLWMQSVPSRRKATEGSEQSHRQSDIVQPVDQVEEGEDRGEDDA